MPAVTLRAAVAGTAILLAASAMPALAQSEASCAALLGYAPAGLNLKITTAAHHANRQTAAGPRGPGVTLPPHCHVEGELDRRTGVAGQVAHAGVIERQHIRRCGGADVRMGGSNSR